VHRSQWALLQGAASGIGTCDPESSTFIQTSPGFPVTDFSKRSKTCSKSRLWGVWVVGVDFLELNLRHYEKNVDFKHWYWYLWKLWFCRMQWITVDVLPEHLTKGCTASHPKSTGCTGVSRNQRFHRNSTANSNCHVDIADIADITIRLCHGHVSPRWHHWATHPALQRFWSVQQRCLQGWKNLLEALGIAAWKAVASGIQRDRQNRKLQFVNYMITTFTGSNPYSWHESSLQHQEHHVWFHTPLTRTARIVFARNQVDSTSAERMSLTPTPMALWPYGPMLWLQPPTAPDEERPSDIGSQPIATQVMNWMAAESPRPPMDRCKAN